jgi:hypothetical protein
MTLLNEGEIAFTGSPTELLDLARGNAWLIKATEQEYNEINEKLPVISTVPSEGGWEIQVVCNDPGSYRSEPIEPTLEHAYVHFMENVVK